MTDDSPPYPSDALMGVDLVHLLQTGEVRMLPPQHDRAPLDFGPQREDVLNATNDFHAFTEEWLGVTRLGLESYRRDLAEGLCPNDLEDPPSSPDGTVPT